jgi:hypothetical protein
VPLHDFNQSTVQFPIQKCAIFCKVKEIGGIACAAYGSMPPRDAAN